MPRGKELKRVKVGQKEAKRLKVGQIVQFGEKPHIIKNIEYVLVLSPNVKIGKEGRDGT